MGDIAQEILLKINVLPFDLQWPAHSEKRKLSQFYIHHNLHTLFQDDEDFQSAAQDYDPFRLFYQPYLGMEFRQCKHVDEPAQPQRQESKHLLNQETPAHSHQHNYVCLQPMQLIQKTIHISVLNAVKICHKYNLAWVRGGVDQFPEQALARCLVGSKTNAYITCETKQGSGLFIPPYISLYMFGGLRNPLLFWFQFFCQNNLE